MTHLKEEKVRHVLGFLDPASIVLGVEVPSMIHEQTKTFDFYSVTSYALDYGNNDTQLHLRVSCQSQEQI